MSYVPIPQLKSLPVDKPSLAVAALWIGLVGLGFVAAKKFFG